MKKFFIFILIILNIIFVTSFNYDKIYQQLSKLTLEEKIGQLFVIRPESINPELNPNQVNSIKLNGALQISNKMKEYYKSYPAGGFIIFDKNIESNNQLIKLNSEIHSLNPIKPFIYVDEEGGLVSRIANNKNLNIYNVKSMNEIGAENDENLAFQTGNYIGSYLSKLGFDVDFAPVCDVYTKQSNNGIGFRSFSEDPEIVSKLSIQFYNGLKNQNINGCYKHFPGHGSSKTDTHINFGIVDKTWDELLKSDLIPFIKGIENDINFLMIAHIKYPNVTKENYPASLSKTLITEKLRNELNYKGIIITDGMAMGAITKNYPQNKSAVLAIQAGVDIILMPFNYEVSFNSVLNAVKNNEISENRINESVYRILKIKNSCS